MSHSLQVLYPITESTNFTNTKPIMLIGEVVG